MSDQVSLAKYEFKRQIEEIQAAKGRATELISLYVPFDRQISDVVAYLRNEFSQSSNIKSKSTKKNVTAAIESIMSRLKNYKRPPENGVVFFVGHKAATGDQTEMVQFVIEPPDVITTFFYRCDSLFYLDPLMDMLKEKDSYGLLVIDRSEATLGILRGKRIQTIKNVPSLIPSKHGKGGQSQNRFERLIEIAAHEFYKKIEDLATDSFLGEDLKGILVGGPGPTKEFFLNNDYLHHELRKKVLDTFDICYTDESGLRELVDKAQDHLSDLEVMQEKKVMQRFFAEIRKNEGCLATYGEKQIREAIQLGAVDTLLVSESLRKFRLQLGCTQCNHKSEMTTISDTIIHTPCPDCHEGELVVKEATDLIQEFFDSAVLMGTSVALISPDSEEGQILITAFGGVAAILRFKVTA